MVTRLYEWDKNETGWTWIEVTENKVINLILRSLNNLIKVNDNNEVYTDLQLDDNLLSTATLPVWVTTGRVLQANGWVATWTLLSFKTTSWNYVYFIFGDDWKLYIDNWTGTFKQIYLKSEVDNLFTALRWELATVATSWSYTDLSNIPWVCEITVQLVDTDYIWTATKIWDLVDGATIVWHSNGLQGLQWLSIAWVSYTVINWIWALDNWTHFYGIYREWYWVIIYSFNNN